MMVCPDKKPKGKLHVYEAFCFVVSSSIAAVDVFRYVSEKCMTEPAVYRSTCPTSTKRRFHGSLA